MLLSIFFLKLLRFDIFASDEDHVTQHLPTGICILHQPGLVASGKRSLVFVIFTSISLWLSHGNMFPVYCPKSVRDIPSGSKLLLDLFPVSKVGTSILLEFSKDGLADIGDKFPYGDSANQPVIL